MDPALRGQYGHPSAPARRRGSLSTKFHLRTERGGNALIEVLTGSECHEQTALPTLMEHGTVRRAGNRYRASTAMRTASATLSNA
ncbi:MAG TPA: hypothetical protein DEU95_04355 [Chloroflexi bacterium]|jgi:hypothetical protein|nr:hypothetical protein [Chloroflexota bacterium]HCG28976.1 hypothetical protein [Chloroflexota bacterium]